MTPWPGLPAMAAPVAVALVVLAAAETAHRVPAVWGITAVVAVAATASVLAGRWVAGPVRECTRTVREFVDGGWSTAPRTTTGPAELRRLAAAVGELGERLRHLRESQRSFVADASHQLRNPLVALRLRLENLEPHIRVDGGGQLESALREADRMSLILNALMTLARGEGGVHTRGPIDVSAVLADRVSSWEPVAAAAGVDLVQATCSRTWASALPAAVDQVLDVFIDNALRVSPQGTTVRLSAESTTRQVRVRCRDEGPGMDPAEAARACERYWRGAQSVDSTGAGLGLSIAAGLARASDGWLDLRPAPNTGTDAVLVLRAVPPEMVQGNSREALPAAAPELNER